MEVLDFTVYITLYELGVQTDKCETVQESVKVSGDFHRFLSFASEVALPPLSGQHVFHTKSKERTDFRL